MEKFFNAAHAPSGAYSTFTLGSKGAKGGFGINLGGSPLKNIYIGLGKDKYNFLPFFDQKDKTLQEEFSENETFEKSNVVVRQYDDNDIQRIYDLGTDQFATPDFSMSIFTPNLSISDERYNICPVIIVEIDVKNEQNYDQNFVFAFDKHSERGGFYHHKDKETIGIIDNGEIAVVTNTDDSTSGNHFSIKDMLNNSWIESGNSSKFMLGDVGGIITKVPANSSKKIRYVVSFYQGCNVTTGIRCAMNYTKYFQNIEEVFKYGLEKSDDYIRDSRVENEKLANLKLTKAEKFQIAHATHSYFSSSQYLIDETGEDIYVVNEGEYRMINTLDLAVDHLFFELDKHPKLVKKQLEFYKKYYSYYDEVRTENGEYAKGGISFCHDCGNINQFSPRGQSSYELTNLSGCFSYMTYEQLTNYIIIFGSYVMKTKDVAFLEKNAKLLDELVESLILRDNVDIEKRNGIMSLDSSKVGSGDEITTYDSLDTSLGQARNNTYIISKTYASYCILKELKILLNQNITELENQISLLINTVTNNIDANKLPAILFEESKSLIIPVAEGLAYLKYLNLDEYLNNEYVDILKAHTTEVLKPGICLYENGGYKLSSTSDMTWLSKIYVSMYVHQEVFKIDQSIINQANEIAVNWLCDPELSHWAWSDQILGQKIRGSKYYPRGVTNHLWTTLSR